MLPLALPLVSHPLMNVFQGRDEEKASVRQEDVCRQKGLSALSTPLTTDPVPAADTADGPHTYRNARSMCWCIVEAVLTAIIFAYTIKGAVKIFKDQQVAQGCFLFPPVAICIGFSLWVGASHSLRASRVQKAVGSIVSLNLSEIERVGPGSWADSLSLDGVDLYEYHDVMSLALIVLKVVSVWLLLQTFSLGVTLCFVAYIMLAFSIATDPGLWLLGVFVVLWVGCYVWVVHTNGVVRRVWRLGEACRTRPFHLHVMAVLLLSSLVYAVLLYLSPAPPMWYGCLIVLHTLRVLQVLASLRGQNEEAEETGTMVAAYYLP